MIDLFFKRSYSQNLFNALLLIFCIGMVYFCSVFAGDSFLNYFIGGMFWVAGRHFYVKFDRIINPPEDDEAPKPDGSE